MSMNPHYLGASIPDALRDPAIKEAPTTAILCLSYPLSEVGYPGTTEESMDALCQRLKDYSVKYLNETPLGIEFSGSITDVFIAQDMAWVSVAVLYQANSEKVEKKLRETGYQIGNCGLHYSRQNIRLIAS